MKKNVVLGLFFLQSFNSFAIDSQCKTLKSCTQWVSQKTGSVYNETKLNSRSLKLDKELDLEELNSETAFTYILAQNELMRVKRADGTFDVLPLKNIKDITFPIVNIEELKPNFDFYAIEFKFLNVKKTKSVMSIFKKYISKNARMVESSDGTRIFITDYGLNLYGLKEVFKNL